MVTNTDSLIDSRDLMEYLQDNSEDSEAAEFAKEFQDYTSDYDYGEIAIRDSYFTEYVRDLVAECGYIPKDLPSFIESAINWDTVADNVKEDYVSIPFGNTDYWVMS